MTQPKIAFLVKDGQHKLVVVPELPPEPTIKLTCFPRHFEEQQKRICEDRRLNSCRCAEWDEWKRECARLMENAPEIVNPEELYNVTVLNGLGLEQTYYANKVELKHGDQFPLPEGLSLEFFGDKVRIVDSNKFFEIPGYISNRF